MTKQNQEITFEQRVYKIWWWLQFHKIFETPCHTSIFMQCLDFDVIEIDMETDELATGETRRKDALVQIECGLWSEGLTIQDPLPTRGSHKISAISFNDFIIRNYNLTCTRKTNH